MQDHTIDITRQQIADLTGTTPETAIRVTRALQSRGLIEMSQPGIIKVLNPEALQALADE
jgi:CRP-like cAMP-binding protein